jgi:hypothetical protein
MNRFCKVIIINMRISFIFMIIAIPIAYFTYTFLLHLDVNKSHYFHDHESCERVPLEMPAEDLIVCGDYLIGVASDSISMYYKPKSAAAASPGFLFSVHGKTREFRRIKISDFPDDIPLNAHGISLFGNQTLYVISHAYAKGGELVLVFDLSFTDQIHARFIRKIHISDEHGVHNALTVISPDSFYISHALPFPVTPEGFDLSIFNMIKMTLVFTYTHTCGVKYCEVVNNIANCTFKAYGYMPNGVLYKDDKLFVADSVNKTIDIFSVNSDYDLRKEESLAISHDVDNLHYDEGRIYVAGVNRLIDYAHYTEAVKQGTEPNFVPGGVSRIELFNGQWKVTEVLMQDLLSLPTTACIIHGKMVLTSLVDPALLFCDAVK